MGVHEAGCLPVAHLLTKRQILLILKPFATGLTCMPLRIINE